MISLSRFLNLLILISAPAVADVTETLSYKSYIVNHKAGESLLLSLNKSSPVRVKGKLFHGETRYHINWIFWWNEELNGSCSISNVRVKLVVDITLPELISTDAKTSAIFVKYSESLRQHELGHLKMDQEAANEINKGILSLPASSSCSILEQTANHVANNRLDDLDNANEKYDESTQHGRTQGVLLPGQYERSTHPCNAAWCRFIRSLFGYEE